MNMLRDPIFLLWLTVAVYVAAVQLRIRSGNALFNPLLIATVVLIAYLKLAGIDYAAYEQSGILVDFWLKPAVVGLAVPLYLSWRKIRAQWLPIVLSQAAGSLTGIVSGVWLAKWFGAGAQTVTAVAAKSVTTPIAIEITRSVGGIPAITAAAVVVAGMVGQVIGYRMMHWGRLRRKMSQGMSMGTASHALGIAASMERSRRLAAYASLGLIFNGVLTAVLVPLLLPLTGAV